MSSVVARLSLGLASAMRKMGSSLDSLGKTIEITKHTEKLVPSTRFVAVDGVAPKVSEMSFVAPSASVVGDVTIGKESSVWYGAILRGDVNTLTVGSQSSIGDRAVIHVAKIQGDLATKIGNSVTIGAGAMVHAATLKDTVMIGESAQVLDGSVVESNSIVAPCSIVTPGTKIPGGELWAGSPAKKVRTLTDVEIEYISNHAMETVVLASKHATECNKGFEQVLEEKELNKIRDAFSADAPDGIPKDVEDSSDVEGMGHPGLIFRSVLTHPEEAYKLTEKEQQTKK